MAAIGTSLTASTLVLTKGRDFRWNFENLGADGLPETYPVGALYFEFPGLSVANWSFTISGSTASIKIESAVVDTIPNRSKWQLVFLATGEVAGGDPVALGTVKVQGA